jgi:hypothetical protein
MGIVTLPLSRQTRSHPSSTSLLEGQAIPHCSWLSWQPLCIALQYVLGMGAALRDFESAV